MRRPCVAVLVTFNTFLAMALQVVFGAVASLYILGGLNIFLVELKNQPKFFLTIYSCCFPNFLRRVIFADYSWFVLSKINAA